MLNDYQEASYRYYYSADDEDLQPNQINILYTVIKNEVITGEEHTIRLERLGYYSQHGFIGLYNREWEFSIYFDTKTDFTKTIYLDKEILLDNKYIIINHMRITPFSYTIDISGGIAEDAELTNILGRLDELNDELTISFHNNVVLDHCAFSHGALVSRADNEGNINQEGIVYYHLTIMFDKPIIVNNVDAVYFNGEKYLFR